MDRARLAASVGLALLAALPGVPAKAIPLDPAAPAALAAAQSPAASGTGTADLNAADTTELSGTRFTLDGETLPPPAYHPHPTARRSGAVTPAVGTKRQWLGLDETTGKYYKKDYTLKAVGKHIEAWLADDVAFPTGDCRKDAVEITPAQIAGLVTEFDQTIYPKETAAFSTPPDRDGSDPASAGDFTGDGDKTVTLIDNVRDENFYHFPKAVTYVAGFFSAQLNELFDRNVMTIDAYDWKHRFGAAPAGDPTDDLCTSRPARPRMYEGTFAHEWQHLLEYYADETEVSWVNEGLSDFAQTLTGYVDARRGVGESGFDSHITCFEGFGPVKTAFNANPRECGGPQNSLNLWDEGAPSEVLADYGNAYQFMLYLYDRFGLATMTRLHLDRQRHGLDGLQAALPAGTNVFDVLHDFQTATLVDKVVEGGRMLGVPIGRVTSPSLRSTINLKEPADYDTPGAAPNGADYVPLPTPVRSVSFAGAKYLPAKPSGWTVADGTLFSGNAKELDNTAVLPIAVPATDAKLQLETSYAIEQGYDFAYVTVSADGGKTYTPVAGDRTTPGPLGAGLTGTSGATVTAGYDLSAYAGKKVLLGLRYVTDRIVNSGGWRIGAITLGGRKLSDGSTLQGWRSPTGIRPAAVAGWHVTLVGIDGHDAELVALADFAKLRRYPIVVALVAYDEPTETQTQYAPYTLTVNGQVQPGGGGNTP